MRIFVNSDALQKLNQSGQVPNSVSNTANIVPARAGDRMVATMHPDQLLVFLRGLTVDDVREVDGAGTTTTITIDGSNEDDDAGTPTTTITSDSWNHSNRNKLTDSSLIYGLLEPPPSSLAGGCEWVSSSMQPLMVHLAARHLHLVRSAKL